LAIEQVVIFRLAPALDDPTVPHHAGVLRTHGEGHHAARQPRCLHRKPDGSRMRKDVRLESTLRRALARAGIVIGYEHVCRHKDCTHRERANNDALRRCPSHKHKLWPTPVVRPIRFHDLRHTTASLLMMAGANAMAVQRILRHHDPRITTEIYGHLEPGYLRTEIDRLRFAPAPVPQRPEDARALASAPPFAASLLHDAPMGPLRPGPDAEGSKQLSLLTRARHAGVEPATYGSGVRPKRRISRWKWGVVTTA